MPPQCGRNNKYEIAMPEAKPTALFMLSRAKGGTNCRRTEMGSIQKRHKATNVAAKSSTNMNAQRLSESVGVVTICGARIYFTI